MKLSTQLFGKWTKAFYAGAIAIALVVGLGGVALSKKAHADESEAVQPQGTARFDVVDVNGKSTCVIVDTNADQSLWQKTAAYAAKVNCTVRAYYHTEVEKLRSTNKSSADAETTVTNPVLASPQIEAVAPTLKQSPSVAGNQSK